jgi:hypothetical protein
MNKKRFAILMVIALILSSFTFAYANNSGGNNENKDNTPNKKIHIHLQSGKEDISEVSVVINGQEIKLESTGNSGRYTAPKGTDLVSENLTKIIVKTSDGNTTTYSAEESQQGQEGQGSINYRIKTTGSNDVEAVSDDTDNTGDNNTDRNEGGDNPGGSTDGGIVGDGGEIIVDGGTGGTGGTDNATNSPISNDSETFITIELTIQEIPQGTPELQEITSTEETPADTEIEEETLDLEDEETPLAIPSTGVATPLLYGAGALISLLGLLKRR